LLTVETTLSEAGNHWEDSSHAVDLCHLIKCIQSTYFLCFYDVTLTDKVAVVFCKKNEVVTKNPANPKLPYPYEAVIFGN